MIMWLRPCATWTCADERPKLHLEVASGPADTQWTCTRSRYPLAVTARRSCRLCPIEKRKMEYMHLVDI